MKGDSHLTPRARSKFYRGNPALKEAAAAGWEIRITGGDHLRLSCPHGCCIYVTGGTVRGYGQGVRRVRRMLERCPGSIGEV